MGKKHHKKSSKVENTQVEGLLQSNSHGNVSDDLCDYKQGIIDDFIGCVST